MPNITIALDAMSGDEGLKSVIPAALRQIKKSPDLNFIIVGQQQAIDTFLKKQKISLPSNIQIHHAEEIVLMEDKPSDAVRRKRDSSMRVAIDLVKEGKAQAAVSAGNTGALVAISRYVLKTLTGIKSPAIVTSVPTLSGKSTFVLDMGANIDCNAEQLLQFALMGSLLYEAVEHQPRPSIALLNIGEEELKGNALVQEAATLLEHNPQLNYVGFAEGGDIFKGEIDVIVCDGFVGNSVLKACEGVINVMFSFLKDAFMKTLITKLRALVAKPVLKRVKKKVDPERHNGSCLLGLREVVVKSHGSANEKAFYYAIEQAKLAVLQNLPQKIATGLGKLHN